MPKESAKQSTSDSSAPDSSTSDKWELRYREWESGAESLREALTTLGNGYFATRGAAEESTASDVHYPGTYLAGGYNRLESEIAQRAIESEDLVNWPNWLALTFRCEEAEWFNLNAVTLLDYEQRLDVRQGLLIRRLHFRTKEHGEFRLTSRRLVHMGDPHVAAIEWELTPLDWSGRLEVRSSIDGRVSNQGVARYRAFRGNHFHTEATGSYGDASMFLVSRTRQSQIQMAQAVRTRVIAPEQSASPRRTDASLDRVSQYIPVVCRQGEAVRIEKTMCLYTSRDFAVSEPLHDSCEHLERLADFDSLLESHRRAWRQLWHRSDLRLSGPLLTSEQLKLRIHVYHILQTASSHTIGRDVGIPARGWHGEAYRGHIFWDELFTFPYLNFRQPGLTRSLLLYRCWRLDEARHAASQAGHRGAMFPWQSGSNGREESQIVHLNPKSGRWIEDHTHRQRHVNAAIAFNVWQYYQVSGDIEFLSEHGAEVLLEIARFWASISTYDEQRQRYQIVGVVGPDEFHTRYPNTDKHGLDNNAYTNVMAVWVLVAAQKALSTLAADRQQELLEWLGISQDELSEWDTISRRMYVPFNEDGLISQFDGWEQLEELDWEGLRQRHGDIQRLDRILEAEGDDPNRYKATKQADVLMLFYLLSAEELGELMARLGYEFDPQSIPDNVKYYLDRTSHGSTLSGVVHAWVLARTDRKRSWHLFKHALDSDVNDVQRGTTAEGIHLGAMAGTVDLMQRCYTGMEVREDVLWLNPRLPEELDCLEFTVRYRGHWLNLNITQEVLKVTFEKGWSGPARVGFKGTVHTMAQSEQMVFELEEGAPCPSSPLP